MMIAALRGASERSADEDHVGGILPKEGKVTGAASTISASSRKVDASVVAVVETRPAAVASSMITA